MITFDHYTSECTECKLTSKVYVPVGEIVDFCPICGSNLNEYE